MVNCSTNILASFSVKILMLQNSEISNSDNIIISKNPFHLKTLKSCSRHFSEKQMLGAIIPGSKHFLRYPNGPSYLEPVAICVILQGFIILEPRFPYSENVRLNSRPGLRYMIYMYVDNILLSLRHFSSNWMKELGHGWSWRIRCPMCVRVNHGLSDVFLHFFQQTRHRNVPQLGRLDSAWRSKEVHGTLLVTSHIGWTL